MPLSVARNIEALFVPYESGGEQEFELILLNRTGVNLTFRWELNLGKQHQSAGTGHVAAQDFAILTLVPLDALNERPSIRWEIWPEDKDFLPFSRVHRIKASSFFKGRRHVDELGAEAHVLEVAPKLSQKPQEKLPDLTWLDENSWPEMENLRRQTYGHDVSTVDNEVDLHIEELREDHATLTSAEKLAAQLEACDAYLQRALIAGHNHVYLIHGIGSGKLRQAIHKLLKDYPHIRSFSNAYHPRYGLGATEVRF